MRSGVRALWTEPRPAHPPVRVWRDWALVGVLVCWSVTEVLLREDLTWRPAVLTLTVSVVVALTMLWRRTRPLAAVMVAFGTTTAFDAARVLTIDATGLWSTAGLLVLPYALFRWGAGHEAATGIGAVLVWLGVTHVADPTDVAEVVAGYGFFLFSAALGASVRYYANARMRDIEQAKLRERNQLARELHDTVGHHVSAIAIQAQAGARAGSSGPRPCTGHPRDHRGGGVADARGDARHGRCPARRDGARPGTPTRCRRPRTARVRQRGVTSGRRAALW